ncbi:hypothetical protein FRC07_000756 [Ceratobasidium sp. 392]|nr:hypothetical protein FRC07_000756 [Ceratobasidium sp. 392]
MPGARSPAVVVAPMPVPTSTSTSKAAVPEALAPRPSTPRPVPASSPRVVPLPSSPRPPVQAVPQPTQPAPQPTQSIPQSTRIDATLGAATHDDVSAPPTIKNTLDRDRDDLDSAFAATSTDNEAPSVAVAVKRNVDMATTTASALAPKPAAAPKPTPGSVSAPLSRDVPAPTSTRVPAPAPVRVPTPVSSKNKTTHRTTASESLVREPTTKRRGTGIESAGETSGTERATRKKSIKKKSARGTEDRADLAAMLRDSDGPSPHVHFPAPSSSSPGGAGLYVATAPPVPKPVGSLFLPSTGASSGTTRSDVGPARTNHFDAVPPSPVSASRGRSGSGSTGFFGRVAGLFGRKKHSGDGFGPSSGASSTWKTRTDTHIARGRDDSSSDEHHGNLVTVTNVATPAGRLASIDNPTPSSPRTGLGRKLTKADRGQTLRVGPPESPVRTRKTSLTDREERIEPVSPGGKKPKSKKAQSQSVDGGGVSRRGSLKSTTSEPVAGRGGRKKAVGAANLMSLVEAPSPLILPSDLAARRSDSPARSPTRTLLSVPPARTVSPATTAAPRPVRATSPMPLKSAMRNRSPSPMPHVTSPVQVGPPTQVASPTLVATPPAMTSASPRNSVAESVYETGEEDFEDASDGEGKSDVTAAGRAPSPTPKLPPIPATSALPVPTTTVAPQSPGTALAAFKDTISGPLSDATATASVSTTQPARRKSVRINSAPPEMSATPSGTPAMELDEEPQWSKEQPVGGGWRSRIGRGWDDSSEESDEEYEKVRRALASSHKHMDAVNGAPPNGKGKERGRR